MSPEERQEALMGGLTIRGVLENVITDGLIEWAGEVKKEEGIEIADDEMVVGETVDRHGLLVRIGTRTWRIEATEVTP